MSSRPQLKPFQCVHNGDMSASITSIPSVIGQITYLNYSVSWTGTPTGLITIEICSDAQLDPNGQYIAGTGTWITLPLTANIAAVGSADTANIDIEGVGAAFIRLHYIRSSGSGTLNATIAGHCA